MLGGLVILAREAGTWSVVELLADPPGGIAAGVGLGLVVLGIVTKSAQYPFHAWLPGAMVAPTPVSAYLHSATMVKAGIYLVVRLAPAFADLDAWRPVVLTVGLVTMLGGGLRALRQDDLKLLLAFGTVSQLGFLFVLTGIGLEDATIAGITLLVAHAAVQGGPVPRRRHRRPPGPHPRPHRTARPASRRRVDAGPGLRGPDRRVDGRRPAAGRLHRQGGGVRRLPAPRRHGGHRRDRRHRGRVGADDGVQPPLRCRLLAAERP